MSQIHVSDIPEMLVATLPLIQRDQPVFEAQNLQEYPAVEQLMRKGRALIEEGTGTSVEVPIVMTGSNRAKGVTLDDPDEAQFGHTSVMQQVQWRHSKTDYAYERRLILMNSGSEERIYNYMTQERNVGWLSLYEYLENIFWSLTAVGNDVDAYGIHNYIVYNATTGFTGTVPSGFTTVAGVNPTTYPKWTNYSANYTNISEDDFMPKMWSMKDRTGFKRPMKIEDYYSGMGDQNQYYCNRDTLNQIRQLAQARNEDLGFDIGADGSGRPVFDGNPINRVPAFDGEFDFPGTIASTCGAIYQINWKWLGFVFLKGDYLHEDGPMQLPDRHNWYGVFVDLTHNLYCKSRRAQGVMAKSAPV